MKIHIDFDSFYASCEAARRGLGDAHIAVFGGLSTNPMVLAASYGTKALGVHTTQRLAAARALCPGLICIMADMKYYRHVSAQAKEFFAYEIPLVEQYSVDEFFGDLTGWVRGEEATKEFCINLQQKTLEKFGLKASIGASNSKWSAKLLTTLAKPNGVLVSEQIRPFLTNVAIEKFPGVGGVLAAKLRAHGVATLDAAIARPELFSDRAQKAVYRRLCGIDGDAVLPVQEVKSLGASRTFSANASAQHLQNVATVLSREITRRVLIQRLNPRTLVLTYKAKNGTKSWRKRLSVPFYAAEIISGALELAQTALRASGAFMLSLSVEDFALANDAHKLPNVRQASKKGAIFGGSRWIEHEPQMPCEEMRKEACCDDCYEDCDDCYEDNEATMQLCEEATMPNEPKPAQKNPPQKREALNALMAEHPDWFVICDIDGAQEQLYDIAK